MKVVGIVGRPSENKEDIKNITCSESYRRCLLKYDNILPIMILPFKDVVYNDITIKDEEDITIDEKKKLDAILEMCDGIIMPGGNKWYKYDVYITDYMIKHDKPLLGICLGMQVMNCVDNQLNNGIFDKNELNNTDINHCKINEKYVHEVSINKDTLLYDILKKDKLMVNSRHNYHIPGTLNFKVSAISEDGLIESIEYPNKRFILGVQWHPEDMIEYDEDQIKIIDRFIEEVNKYGC